MRAHLVQSTAVLLLAAIACGPDGDPTDPQSRPSLNTDPADRYSAWSAPVNLGPVVNSNMNDLAPEISKDGLSLYFGSNRVGGAGGNDLYVAQRADLDSPWGAPVNLGPVLNTTFNEAGAHLSRDGHWLFFTSTRPGNGGNDLWVTYRKDTHDDFAWQVPENLGQPISSTDSDLGPSIFGREFYFWRANPVTTVPGDIWMSEMTGHTFGAPQPVTALNAPGHDEKPGIRFDGREIVFASDRAGTLDIWVSTRSGSGQEWSAPENLGFLINSATAADRRPSLSPDGLMLLFDSTRPGTGTSGMSDIYISTRTHGRGSPD